MNDSDQRIGSKHVVVEKEQEYSMARFAEDCFVACWILIFMVVGQGAVEGIRYLLR